MSHVRLPEVVVSGQRLGRNINQDPRSLRFALPAAKSVVSVEWPRHIPILDQGNYGACTGNAEVGALGSGPLFDALAELIAEGLVLDERLALAIYSDAEKLDGGAGLPSEDNGSSGLSVAKVATRDGYIAGYQHATSVAAAHTALQAGPFIVGTNWYSGMDEPNSAGVVTATGTLRGGHEYLCRQYDAGLDLWWMDNSWSVRWGVTGRFAYDTPTFERLLDQSGDVTALVPITQPAPAPAQTPIDAFMQVAKPWVAERHTSIENRKMQVATQAYIAAIGNAS